MAAILGISAHYHDAAAALVVDGEVVAAIQEERLSRVKNDPSLPRRAALACLAEANLNAEDLDEVVFYENPFAKLERVLVSLLRTFPRGLRQFPRAIGAQLGSKMWVLDAIADLLDIDRKKVRFGDHHRSHAASAFYASPFDRAAVLTVDGVGEDATTAIWRADATGNDLTCLASVSYPHSLGLFYAALTAYLGFEVNEGEYKVMGLSAFGTPRYRDEFAKLLLARPDGSFELGLPYFAFTTDVDVGFGPRLERLLGPRRPPGKPWDVEADEDDRRYADVAATLQAVTEDALVALAREARRRTGLDVLCLAGGVALNAVANARILREAGFSRVFVQPAAGDAGGALGAALDASAAREGKRPRAPQHAALGRDVSDDEARTVAEGLGLHHEPMDDVPAGVASLVAEGKVVAFARGRYEWGPRALGRRSILASPRDATMRDRINRAIKRREPFRPFAPAVLATRASEWFDDADNDMTPFMTTVCNVVEARRPELAAVTHVDGTARLQTVTATSAPDLHGILCALEAVGHAPIVLNTSLNGPGEPIVASASDALCFFASHAVDALVVGNTLLRRRPS
jgi:carbamoyltransferase